MPRSTFDFYLNKIVCKASTNFLNFLDSISSAVITSTLAVTFFNFSSDFVALEIVISSKELVCCEYKFVAIKKLATKLTFIFSFFSLFIYKLFVEYCLIGFSSVFLLNYFLYLVIFLNSYQILNKTY